MGDHIKSHEHGIELRVSLSESLIWLAYFATFAGYAVWRFTFTNFAVEEFGVDAQQVGVLFAIAGIPGVLAFAIALAARKIRIVLLLPLCCALVGGGLGWIGVAPAWQHLWPGVLAVSLGVACFYPVITSLCLLDTSTDAASISIGRLKSFGPLASIGAAFLVLYLMPHLGVRSFLVVTGLAVLTAGVVAGSGMGGTAYAPIHGNLNLRIALWPYYLLNFLAGCRSALFKVFAIFVLVNEYGFEFDQTALIVLAANGLTFLGYHLIGFAAHRFGNKNILSFIYVIVALIFLGFSTIDSGLVLSALFLLDSLVFGASVATESHLKQVSAPEDFIGNVAVGLTLFSLAGLVMPLVGGYVMAAFGREPAFLMGTALAIVAIVVSRMLGRYHKG